jgi:anti-anti-sigma regulatory factor
MAQTRHGRGEPPREADVEVLGVAGLFDRIEAEQVRDRIIALAARGQRRFVVDLANVEAMAPQAMTPLLQAARRLQPDDGRVSVVFDPFLTVFAAEGLEDLFDVAVTREDALRRIRA